MFKWLKRRKQDDEPLIKGDTCPNCGKPLHCRLFVQGLPVDWCLACGRVWN